MEDHTLTRHRYTKFQQDFLCLPSFSTSFYLPNKSHLCLQTETSGPCGSLCLCVETLTWSPSIHKHKNATAHMYNPGSDINLSYFLSVCVCVCSCVFIQQPPYNAQLPASQEIAPPDLTDGSTHGMITWGI